MKTKNDYFPFKLGSGLLSLLLIFIVTGCSPKHDDISQYIDEADEFATDIENQYEISLLLLHGDEGIQAEGILHHFKQSLIPNLHITTASVSDVINQPFDYDLIYLDEGLSTDKRFAELTSQLIEYTDQGGILFLQHEYGQQFPADFIGIHTMEEVNTTDINFTFPHARDNYSGIQKAWEAFSSTYNEYNGLNPEYHISHEFAAKVDTATSLVEQDGLSYLLAHDVGDGTVFWANNFLPNEQFITRFDFQAEEDQRYFHYGYATANYLFRNELVNYTSKEKYGYTLKKAYGPYGRPGIAWQNHYEEAYSFVLEDLINWTEWLKKENQIPTFSIIRGSYNWGQWHTSLAIHENVGTNESPRLIGESENSFYSSGVRLTSGDKYLQFDRYPGYHTLLSPLDLPYRAYPTVLDWNGDGLKDLVVGTAEGELYLIENKGTSDAPSFKEKQLISELKVSEYAAPYAYDLTNNGLSDLVIGTGDGTVEFYFNTGTKEKPNFSKSAVTDENGQHIAVSGVAAPAVADWNGDGVPDLFVGDENGQITLFIGESNENELTFTNHGLLQDANNEQINVEFHAAPHVYDWNSDGRLDLLVGSLEGKVHVYLQNSEGKLEDQGLLEGETMTFYGDQSIHAGKNAVPVVVDWNNDGNHDLLMGQLEYGIPASLESEFYPHPEARDKNIQYALDNHLTLIPHMYLHEYLDEERELREMELHKQSFADLGIPWDEDMGVNHHTWRINQNALQTFRNQNKVGIWWNLGFNPPNVGSAPRDGVEFLMTIPFLVEDEEIKKPFVTHSPVPHALNFSDAWYAMANFDIPYTYFEHIEHSLEPGTNVYKKLENKINFMNEFREDEQYTFMTEEQMARSLLTTFTANVHVEMDGDTIHIVPDYSEVPEEAKEYRETLGIRIELGEKYADHYVHSPSTFFTKHKERYYIGLGEPTSISFSTEASNDDKIRIIRSNGPVEMIAGEENEFLTLKLETTAMQEVALYSPVPLQITGDDIKVIEKDQVYTVIHYGDVAEIRVAALKE